MADFIITAPDGKRYKVSGADQAGAVAALKKMLGGQAQSQDPMAERIAAAKAGTLRASPDSLARAAQANAMTGIDPSLPPEGMVTDPRTGQMTNRELMANAMKPGVATAVGVGGMQGASFGAADELAGFVGGDFRREQMRAALDASRRDRPATTMAAEIAGGVAVPAPFVGGAATTAGAIGRAAGAGAVMGSGYAFNQGEGGADSRLAGVPMGAVGGAIGGALSVPLVKGIGIVGRKFGSAAARLFRDSRMFDPATGLTDTGRQTLAALGYNADDVSKAFAAEFQKNIDAAVDPQAAAKAAGMAEFDIPAYRHNITGTVDDFAKFESARRGGSGSGAEAKVRAAGDSQFDAMRRAGDDIAVRIGGGQPADQADAAVAVAERLRSVAASEKAAAGAAYDAADAAGLRVRPDVARGVVDRVRTSLAAQEIDVTGLPESSRFLARLQTRAATNGDGVSLRLIDGARKDLNKALRSPSVAPEDARALTIIKSEYDQWLDDVVAAKLFDGDGKGLETLKEARGLWAEYAQKFAGKDRGSKFLQAMVDSDASPDEVVRWLFGAGKLGAGKMNASLAGTLRDTLGDTSTEWNMVRQAAFRQMTQKPEGTLQWGPQKVSENILNFVNSPGTRDLSRTMFNADELALMRRYAGALKQMVPPPGAVNTSNTAYQNARNVRQLFQLVGAAIGMTASGGTPGTGLAGGAAVKAAQGGANWLAARTMLKGATSRPVSAAYGPTAAAQQGAAATSQLFQDRPR